MCIEKYRVVFVIVVVYMGGTQLYLEGRWWCITKAPVSDTVYIHTAVKKKRTIHNNTRGPTSQDCLLSMILRMASLRAWWTKGVAVAFMYCSISVLASVVALNSVVASSTGTRHHISTSFIQRGGDGDCGTAAPTSIGKRCNKRIRDDVDDKILICINNASINITRLERNRNPCMSK